MIKDALRGRFTASRSNMIKWVRRNREIKAYWRWYMKIKSGSKSSLSENRRRIKRSIKSWKDQNWTSGFKKKR